MKKKLLFTLLFPLLLSGCSFNLFKKSDANSDQDRGQDSGEVTPQPTEHSINVIDTEISIEVGLQYQINIVELKKTIIICQSSNDSVASVTQGGLVSALSPGEATISISGGQDRFNVFVTVLPPEAKDSLQIVMVKQLFTISLGDEYTLPLAVKLGNQLIEDATLTYQYETEGIVSISGLDVTPLAVGTTKCVVSASYNEMNTSSSFTITVY